MLFFFQERVVDKYHIKNPYSENFYRNFDLGYSFLTLTH